MLNCQKIRQLKRGLKSDPMVSLTFYGGVNEIGGNKILLEDKGARIWFDFGLSFKKGQKFYTGFLTARRAAGCADDLELGIIPRIEGLYSEEMLKFTDLKYKEPEFDGIVISHAHMDHCAHLQYIDEKIPIYLGETTHAIIKTIEETSSGVKFGEHKYRKFRTGNKITIGSVEIEPIHVDHSIPGAYGFLIHTTEGTIVYTGDIRFHGPAAIMSIEFIKKAKESRPIALIIEGTRLGREEKTEKMTEADVQRLVCKILKRTRKFVATTFYGRDYDRIMSFYHASLKCERKFTVSMRTAHLLNKLKHDKRLNCPDPLKDPNILIYIRRKKSYYKWERPYINSSNAVNYEWIRKNFSNVLLNLDLYNFAELVDIKPDGGDFIHSMSEPFVEGGLDQIEQEVMLNWLEHFNLKFHQAHASGHCSVKDLGKVVRFISPKVVIPVHTENARLFRKFGVKVKQLKSEKVKIMV